MIERPSTGDGRRDGHAVVIGGSIAGLAAASVLGKHFARVTIFERDATIDRPEGRRGVPQGRHVHVLLVRGREALERLVPGLRAGLIAAGAVPYDELDLRWQRHGCERLRGRSGVRGLAMSRSLLETELRRRVLAAPNVTAVVGAAVEGVLRSADRPQLTGIRIRREGEREEAVAADLVVDASGRGSRMPRWLEERNLPCPPVSEVRIDVGYASRIFRRRPDELDAAGLACSPTPPSRRGGVLFPIEGDRWMASIGGWHGDHAPTDERGWLEFARSLPMHELHRVVSSAQPLGDVVPHRQPSNLRRRYERLSDVLDGLVVLGDALASFNPIYGHGMTVAALEAEALAATIAEAPHPREIARRFRRRAAAIVDLAWDVAVTEDFGWRETTGVEPRAAPFLRAYGRALHVAASRDRVVARAFARAQHLLDSPHQLLRPAIVARVLLSSLVERRHPRRGTAPAVGIARPEEGIA